LLIANPANLVLYGSSTAIGDPTRPNFIYNQLTGATQTFSAQTGIGSTAAPFTGNLPTFLRQIIAMQGEAASNASNLAQGQDVVVNALQQRVNDSAGVNVDQEMANLITLQTSYAANARVMSAVKDMMDRLLNM
jgi:flagellar hook-associated protein 1 FlgK